MPMGLRILQVDDDHSNNLANERLIRKLGFEISVDSFLDPEEALQHLGTAELQYELILLDINMPRLSGWEFLDRFSKMNSKIPVIMVSSSVDPNDKKRAMANPLLSGFYIKPLQQPSFIEIFERIGIQVP